MPEHPDLDKLIDPGADHRGGQQAPTKRFPWSKAKVRTKPTRADKREFRRAHARTAE